MPVLQRFTISNIRNISAAELYPSSGLNLISGPNGSGKTSVLEAVYLLAMGRSFRSHLQRPLIREDTSTATVFGETADAQILAIQRDLRGPPKVNINGNKTNNVSSLARALPLQLICSDSFAIFEGSPRDRRQCLDWGVFHVEQAFVDHWRRAKAALLNRNSLLKAAAPLSQIEPWSRALSHSSEYIDRMRMSYALELEATLRPTVEALLGLNFSTKLKFSYLRGWPSAMELSDQLTKDLDRDRRKGFTSSGPQKADLRFQLGQVPVAEVLSRGQLKLLVCALKVAQSKMLYQTTRRNCVFLIDDLPAELDVESREKVCAVLGDLGDQVFLSSIEDQALLPFLMLSKRASPPKVFHVKHGTITDVSLAPS